MIYTKKPFNFSPKFSASGCFLKINDCGVEKFLVFLRQDYKPQGNTWSVPAGKIEDDESPFECMIRELKEETGLLFNVSDLKFHKKFNILYDFEKPAFDFEYNVFSIELNSKPDIKIDLNDHKEFRWVTPSEAFDLTLIPDEEPCIKLVYSM